MRTRNITSLLSFIVSIVIISLLTSGGCGIGFSNSNSNGGGGGTTGSDLVQGTITSITNISSTSGIQVQATDASTNTFSTTTDSGGFFQIQDNFIGSSLRLDFLDQSGNLLAVVSVTIFPGIQIDLGLISITNGNVTLSNNITVTLNGAVISENNCSVNSGTSVSSGTLVVTTGNTDVIVQVLTTTKITNRLGATLSCGDLSSGGIVNVSGFLIMGNTVQANTIQLR